MNTTETFTTVAATSTYHDNKGYLDENTPYNGYANVRVKSDQGDRIQEHLPQQVVQVICVEDERPFMKEGIDKDGVINEGYDDSCPAGQDKQPANKGSDETAQPGRSTGITSKQTTIVLLISIVILIVCILAILVVVLTAVLTGWGFNSSEERGDNKQTTTLPTSVPTPVSPPIDDGCGIHRRPNNMVDHKIVGGKDADVGEWPWQIGLFRVVGDRDQFICGGALISEDWVLTAAHCFQDGPNTIPADYVVHSGMHTLSASNDGPSRTRHVLDDVIIHENFSYPYTNVPNDDIAVLKLTNKADFSVVNRVCMPRKTTVFTNGETCYITGWGLTAANNAPAVLQEAAVPFIDTFNCKYRTGYDLNWITSDMVCAGFEDGGVDSCQGDSGGPLVCLRDGRSTLAGITSWGNGCALEFFPGVYTKVTAYLDWIATKTNITL